MSECTAETAAEDIKPSCFSDPRGWPYTVPGYAELPEHLRQAMASTPPLSPGDPLAAEFRGWLWSEPPPAVAPVMQSAA